MLDLFLHVWCSLGQLRVKCLNWVITQASELWQNQEFCLLMIKLKSYVNLKAIFQNAVFLFLLSLELPKNSQTTYWEIF